MKELKRELQAVLKGLKALQAKTEKLAAKVDKAGKVAAAKPAKAKAKAKGKAKPAAVKKAKKATATDNVLAIVKRSKRGVDTATLKKKTGYKDAKVRSVVYRLKKQGKIKSQGKGLYTAA